MELKSSNDAKGFTLLEILVAVTIIAILSSFILVGLTQIQSRGRDTRRIKDLSEVQHALALYYSSAGLYPNVSSWNELRGELKAKLGNDIIIPDDPRKSAGRSYGYCTNVTRDKYILAAFLEDKNNPELFKYPSDADFSSVCSPVISGTTDSCSKEGSLTSKVCIMF